MTAGLHLKGKHWIIFWVLIGLASLSGCSLLIRGPSKEQLQEEVCPLIKALIEYYEDNGVFPKDLNGEFRANYLDSSFRSEEFRSSNEWNGWSYSFYGPSESERLKQRFALFKYIIRRKSLWYIYDVTEGSWYIDYDDGREKVPVDLPSCK